MRSATSSPRKAAPAMALCALALGVGCDGSQRGRDASVPPSQRVAEVSVRVDVPAGGAPSVSVLAFRATATGLAADDVLGVVDPLVAAAPDGRRCELREVAGAARSLRAEGGAVELSDLADVAVGLGEPGRELRPTARVYPQLAAVVGGLIGEAGPVDVAAVPNEISFTLGADQLRMPLERAPRLLDESRNPLAPGARPNAQGDLVLAVDGPARSFLEVRPFGATLALACPVVDGRVVVTRDNLERLTAASGRVPISFEAVWREWRLLTSTGGPPTRLTVEARSSVVLDLRP